MILTKAERNYLASLKTYRTQPMTVAGIFWRLKYQYLLIFTYFSVMAAACYWKWGFAVASLFLVSFATLLLRDFGFYRRSVKVFRATHAVVDWPKVDRLLFDQEAQQP